MDQVKRSSRPNFKTTSQKWSSTEYDPFQAFEVEHDSCLDFEVTVHKGENITKGSSFQDFLDTPDPYLVLRVPGSAHSRKQTSCIDNSVNPIWDTTFHFYLHPHKEYTLHVFLKDSNYSLDEELGEDDMCINTLQNDVPTDYVFMFPGGSKVYTTLTLRKNPNPDLRFSLALCQEEKEFLVSRRTKNFSALTTLLGPRAPANERQSPIVAVMGSGGGYRAMIGLSGALKVLQESGILDCATYIAGLSGSSWYISTLYAHDRFPTVTHDELQAELKKSVTQDWKWYLRWIPSYAWDIFTKYRRRQPVSFTDVFGHILGDALLQGKKDKKLSDLRRVVRHAEVPFPLFTCLHAKRSITCKNFSEWIEFSPYEIGIAKYGTFMKTEHFGSKFIIGKVIKEYPEFPLHFLQGVWGSAFTILIKRLVLEGGKKKRAQIIQEIQQENMQETSGTWSDSEEDLSDSDDESNLSMDKETGEKLMENFKSHKKTHDLKETSPSPSSAPSSEAETKEKTIGEGSCDDVGVTQELSAMSVDKPKSDLKEPVAPPRRKKGSLVRGKNVNETDCISIDATKTEGEPKTRESKEMVPPEAGKPQTGYLESFQRSILTGANFLNSRTGRAGMIHNPFRGLSLRKSFPLSPIISYLNENEEEETLAADDIGEACRYEPLDNNAKRLYVVDSGLSFNSPYPLLLRPQRGVDLYISFDLSKREKDDHPPFKELLKAEKWAQQNNVPFPPIKDLVAQYEGKPVQECYVFEHPNDSYCPVIIHFCLVNNKFRKYKKPGVPRTTREEKEFADFTLFDDPDTPFETTNFVYSERDFDRLVQLTEFNTSLHVDTIKEVLARACKGKQEHTRAQRQWSGLSKTMKTFMLTSFMKSKSQDHEKELSSKSDAPSPGSEEDHGMRLKLSEENKKKLLAFMNR